MKQNRQLLLSHLLILLAYTIITLIFTHPLVRNMTTHILGDGFDGNQFPIAFWWVKKAITELRTNPLYTEYLFYPFGTSLVFHTTTLLNALLGIPLQYLFGLTATVNIFVLLTFVLSAYGTFVLVHSLTHNRIAAFIGGFVFAFCPYRMMSAMGFHNLLNTQWIPLYVLFLFKLTKEHTWRNSLWAALFLLCTALNSYNYLIILGVFTAVYLGYLLCTDRARLSYHFMKRLALCLGIFLVGFSPVLYQAYLEILSSGGGVMSGEIVVTDMLAYVIPSIFHRVFGNFAWKIFPHLTPYVAMTTVYIGYSIILLAVYSIFLSKKRDRFQIHFWLLCAAVFFVLSLGPYLQIYGKRVFHIGDFVFSIPLPYTILLKIPVLGGARVPARFSVLLMLALAILAGYACDALMKKLPRQWLSWAAVSCVFAVVWFEYLTFPYPRLYEQSVPHVYYEIGQQPEDGTILQIPLQITSGINQLVMGSPELDLCQVIHQKRRIGGYISKLSPHITNYFSQVPILESLISIQQGSPVPPEKMIRDKQLVQKFIRFFNLDYIVVHTKDRIGMGFFMRPDARDVLKNMKQYIQTVFPIKEIQRDPYEEDIIVYTIQRAESDQNKPIRIDFGTPAAHFSLAYNWSRDEVWDGEFPFNWAKTRKSGIFMRLQRREETACTLRVAPFSYPNAPQQHLKIYLNGRFIQKFLLDPSWKEYTITLPANALRVGVNRFEFHYGYAASPSDVLGTPDVRKLSVAFDSIECHSVR